MPDLQIPAFVHRIKDDDPATTIFDHGFDSEQIKIRWFRDELDALDLPGRIDTVGSTEGTERITRGSLFKLAQVAHSTSSDEDLLSLFWSVMCWGTGKSVRNMPRVMLPFTNSRERDRRVTALLASAELVADSRLGEAFVHLRTDGRIKHLNGSFFTKWLYFSGAGASDHGGLILDDRVLATLRREGWGSLPKQGVHVRSAHYVEYVALAQRWASELSDEWGRQVRADEIEKVLWSAAREGGR